MFLSTVLLHLYSSTLSLSVGFFIYWYLLDKWNNWLITFAVTVLFDQIFQFCFHQNNIKHNSTTHLQPSQENKMETTHHFQEGQPSSDASSTSSVAMILDCGSDTIKAGFNFESIPSIIIDSVIHHYTASNKYSPIYPIQSEITHFKEFSQLIDSFLSKKAEYHCNSIVVALNSVETHKQLLYELLFEKYSFSNVLLQTPQICCSFLSQKNRTMLLVDIGHTMCKIVPIYNHITLEEYAIQGPLSGQHVDQFSQSALLFSSSSSSLNQNASYQILFEPQMFDSKRFSSSLGLHHLCSKVLSSFQSQPELQQELMKNIVCVGKSSKWDGLIEKLENELHSLGHINAQVAKDVNNCEYSAWKGAAILSTLPQTKFISKREFEEMNHVK